MRYTLPIVLVFALAGAFLYCSTAVRTTFAESKQSAPTPVAVEDDMHEFMEYVFQPPYKRLRAALVEEPKDNNAWKSVKSDSLILAESANLLLTRAPEDNGPDWVAHSISVRKAGSTLYQSAKKRDYQATKKSFGSMLNKCNACHRQFEEGKHILKP